MSRAGRTARHALRVLRDVGPKAFVARVFNKLGSSIATSAPRMLVADEDAAAVDWTVPAPWAGAAPVAGGGPYRIAWIMSPPGESSGGHHNLFRFIRYAELAGHTCTIHLYDNLNQGVSVEAVRTMLAATAGYAKVDADIRIFDREVGVGDVDALFATGWETAYPAYLDASSARRFYFVQDSESSFYPLGSESLLAENTYRFGFHGITAGKWLSTKLHDEFGMATDHFDFAVDKQRYHVTNTQARSEVFFYARPVTPRRAFEFGVLALAEFAALRPDVPINFGGWNTSGWHVPFEHRNLAAMDISELNAVYNRCAAGLVLSLSNLSLLPLELLSSGVAPVVNDGPNNRLVSDNPYIEYVPASPRAIARRLVEVLERPDAAERVTAMAASVETVDWQDSGDQFVAAFERAMHG